MKRYSTMVKQDGSDHEIELCQVNSNPKKVGEAAGMRRPGQEQHGRRYYTQKCNWIRIVDNGEASLIPHSGAPVAAVATCNPLSLATKPAVGRHRRSSSTEIQLLLPFVTYCGRFPGICPLTDRSSIANIFCYRCGCGAPGTLTYRD